MRAGKIIFFIITFVTIYKPARAQETMLTEVSYTYLDTLIKIAKLNYPKIKVFDKKVTIAEKNVGRTRVSWLDAINVSYLYNPNNTFNIATPTFFSGFQTGITLNVGFLLQRSYLIKIAKNELDISRYEREEYNLNIEALVKERYFLYIQHQTILKARMQNAQDAESILKAARYRFEKGEETLQNFNIALMALSTQNQGKIEAEAQLLIAKAYLEEIIGKKLENMQ